MNKPATMLLIFAGAIGCGQGSQGPAGPPGAEAPSCSCPPPSSNAQSVRERVVFLDAAEFQIADTEFAIEKIPAADWPKGGRVTGLWIESVEKFGLVSSQLFMDIGTPTRAALFADTVPISPIAPSVKGHEGAALGPGAGVALDEPMQLYISSDNLALAGSVGKLSVHVVVETPAPF